MTDDLVARLRDRLAKATPPLWFSKRMRGHNFSEVWAGDPVDLIKIIRFVRGTPHRSTRRAPLRPELAKRKALPLGPPKPLTKRQKRRLRGKKA